LRGAVNKTKEDQEKRKGDPPKPSRRRFFTRIWIALGMVAFGELAAVVISFLQPGKTRAKNGETIIEAGSEDKFPVNSVTAFVRGKFYLARLEDGGFLALSRKCTHLGCTVPWVSDSSAFDIKGEVINPPAPRPLDLYRVFFENKVVKVDTGKLIKRSQFRPEQVAYLK
jgi:cytochrome b6-f complex iron-sulfur subunit